MDPAYVLQGARLVEVENKSACELLFCAAGELYRPPRGLGRGLYAALVAFCVRGEEAAHTVVVAVNEKVHTRIIYEGGFVYVDIDAFVRFHLQGGLDSGSAERGLAVIAAKGLRVNRADFGEAGFGELVFLGVEVSRNPPRGVVACELEFGKLFYYAHICRCIALRKFIAEAEAVIEEAETHIQQPVAFLKVNEGFVIVVADTALFAPNRLPGLVEAAAFGAEQGEAVVKGICRLPVGLGDGTVVQVDFLGFQHAAHLKTEFARGYNLLSVNREVVADFPFVAEADVCGQCSVR